MPQQVNFFNYFDLKHKGGAFALVKTNLIVKNCVFFSKGYF